MAATLSSTHYKFDSCGIIRALKASTAVRRVLIISDHPETVDVTQSWSAWWFTNSTPTGGVVGIAGGGELGSSDVTPLKFDSVTTTGLTVGASQITFDRFNSQGSGNDLRLGWVFNTETPLSGDQTGGVAAAWTCGLFHELMWNSTPPAAGQTLFAYSMNAADTFTISWQSSTLTCLLIWSEPSAYSGGTVAITGGPSLDMVTWRGSGSKTTVQSVTGGAVCEIRFSKFNLAPGSGVPKFGFAQPSSATNVGRRMIPQMAYVEKTGATNGLGIIHVNVPYTSPFNWSNAGNRVIGQRAQDDRSTTTASFTLNQFYLAGLPIHATIVCLCQYMTAQDREPFTEADPDSNDYDEVAAGTQHYPAGHYIESFEDVMDRVRDNMEPLGVTAYRPVMYILSHFHGYGESVALAQTYLDRMKQEFIDSLDLPTSDTYYRQFGLKDRACFVDPWVGITPTMILTGSGAGKYIRRNGTTVKGTYSGATAYVPGDVVCYPAASNYAKGNSGWHVCTAHSTGVAPPNASKWAEVDFTLNDNGMQRVVDFVWNLVGTVSDISRPDSEGILRAKVRLRRRDRS